MGRSPRVRPVTDGQKGFTLMEILMLVAVVVVLAGIAMPWLLGAIESYRLRVAAWEIAGDLRLARQKAVSTQIRHRICFSGCSDTVPAGGYLLEREEASWEVDVTRADLPDGVTVTDNAGGKFTFEAKGDISGGMGTITLTNETGTFRVKTASSGRVEVCKEPCP